MNKKGLNTYIDFGSSRIRIGVFDLESSRNIFTSEKIVFRILMKSILIFPNQTKL